MWRVEFESVARQGGLLINVDPGLKQVLFKLLEDADDLLTTQGQVNVMMLAAIDDLKRRNG